MAPELASARTSGTASCFKRLAHAASRPHSSIERCSKRARGRSGYAAGLPPSPCPQRRRQPAALRQSKVRQRRDTTRSISGLMMPRVAPAPGIAGRRAAAFAAFPCSLERGSRRAPHWFRLARSASWSLGGGFTSCDCFRSSASEWRGRQAASFVGQSGSRAARLSREPSRRVRPAERAKRPKQRRRRIRAVAARCQSLIVGGTASHRRAAGAVEPDRNSSLSPDQASRVGGVPASSDEHVALCNIPAHQAQCGM